MKRTVTTLFAAFFGLASFFVVAEYLSHQNFILNTFQIDYFEFFFSSGFLFGLSFLIFYKLKLLKKYKYFIFVAPLLLTLIGLIVYMRRFDLFLYLEAEDSIIETAQVILLFLSSVLSFKASRLYKQKKVLSTLLLLASVGFFLIFAEEISWGQRIFDLSTPEEYAELNTQGEITIHNYGPIFEYVYKGYALIGLVGSISWVIKRYFQKAKNIVLQQVSLLLPDWHYSLYFFIVFLYNLEVHILNPRSGAFTGNALWEEPMELLLFTGITLFLVELVIKRKYYANT